MTRFPECKSSLLWNFNFKLHMHVDGGHRQKPIDFQRGHFQNGRLVAILDFFVKVDRYPEIARLWCLCAFFLILLILPQCYVPFYMKKKKVDDLNVPFGICAKRLIKAHSSRAIPRYLGFYAAELPVRFDSDQINLSPYFAALRLCKIW